MVRISVVTRVAFAALAVGFFAAPMAARLAGVTAEEFENRRLAHPPQLAQGWDAFAQTTQYVTDHMPLRAQAVRANTQIWTGVFGTDPRGAGETQLAGSEPLPFARVGAATRDEQGGAGLQGAATAKTGQAGWLYIDLEFKSPCDETISNRRMLERWAGLVRTIRQGGRDALLFVVPDKSSVYPEHLPRKYPHDECALAAKERFWRLFSKAGPPVGVHELRSELLRLKADAGDGLFQRKDMHWTTLGALTMVNALLEEVGEDVRLEPNEIIARGPVTYEGDLGAVGGRPASGKRMEYDIVRSDQARRVPGRTLLVCDSFVYKWMRLFKPYFEDVRYVSIYHSAAEIASEIRASDRVVMEAEEVNLKAYAKNGATVPALIRSLRR